MNDNDVACSSADGTSSSRRGRVADSERGQPAATSSMARNSGTRSRVDQSEKSWSTGNDSRSPRRRSGRRTRSRCPRACGARARTRPPRGVGDRREQRAGEERTEDGVEPQPLAHDEQRDHQQHRDPHPQLRAAVLQTEQHLIVDAGATGPAARTSTRSRRRRAARTPRLHDLRARRSIPLGEKNIDSTTIEPNSATEHDGDHERAAHAMSRTRRPSTPGPRCRATSPTG